MDTQRFTTVSAVLLLHAVVLTSMWFARSDFMRREEPAITVALLSERAPAPAPTPLVPPAARIIAVIPEVAANPPSIQLPLTHENPVPAIAPATPTINAEVASDTYPAELAIQCPERTAPRYPPLAKRAREQGEVRLRVELDESGRIDHVTIVRSSGSPRLDEAALTAIESWRCRPARHDGQPVRAVALQSLAFVLERR